MKLSMVVIMSLLVGCEGGTPSPDQVVEGQAEVFRQLLSQDGQDADEKLALGEAIDTYMVRLDELSRFDGSGDPEALFHDTRHRLFPMHGKGGAVRSSITMVPDGSGWQMARAGAANFARQVVTARAALGPKVREVRLVRVFGLQLAFLASTRDGQLMLTPLDEHGKLGVRTHQSEPAAQLLARLAPAAKNVLVAEARTAGDDSTRGHRGSPKKGEGRSN